MERSGAFLIRLIRLELGIETASDPLHFLIAIREGLFAREISGFVLASGEWRMASPWGYE